MIPLVRDMEIESGPSSETSMGMLLTRGEVCDPFTRRIIYTNTGVEFTFDFESYEISARPWSAEEYYYLEDVDLSYLYSEDEITPIETPGAYNVILHEEQWQELTVQLIGDFVQKREGASETRCL